MRKFGDYPIYTLYSLRRQDAVRRIESQHYYAEKNHWQLALDRLLKGRLGDAAHMANLALADETQRQAANEMGDAWEVIEDVEPKYHAEIRHYEAAVAGVLADIAHNPIGRALLGFLRPEPRVYIVPHSINPGTSTTNLYPASRGGGIHILYDPDVLKRVGAPGGGTEDARAEVLFHELVHAMRFSTGRYRDVAMGTRDYGRLEEFVATQFENVFRSTRRPGALLSTYNGDPVQAGDAYAVMGIDPEQVLILQMLLDHEPLARRVAQMPGTPYNPFRDIAKVTYWLPPDEPAAGVGAGG